MGMTGPDGQAVDASLLDVEIATPTVMGRRRTIEDQVAGQLAPERLARILRSAALGEHRDYLTLAVEMEERYLHYASQLQTRHLALDGVEASVDVPKGVPTKIGDFVHELVEDPEFEAMTAALNDGVPKGYSVVETLWDYRDNALRPISYVWRDQRFFRFDKLTHRNLRLETDGNFEGEPLPAAKFVRHVPAIRTGIPSRTGLARSAAWAFMIQSFALQDWAAFAEVYGVPMRFGKYARDANDKDKRALLAGLRMFANDGAAIIPQGAEIEFAKIEGSHAVSVFGGLLDYVDRQISKLVVGQTMTADDGSSMAQAKVHNEVRLDIIKADARQRARTVNRDLIQWAVSLNFGPQERYPTVSWPIAEPEDVQALADAVVKLVPLGFRVGQAEMRGKLGLGEPEAEEELLAAPAPPPPPAPDPKAPPAPTPKADPKAQKPAGLSAHVQGCLCGGCRTAALAAEALPADGVAEVDALLGEDWEEISRPLLEPVLAAIEQADSFDEAIALLEAAGPDSRPLAEQLARLMATARGIGDLRD